MARKKHDKGYRTAKKITVALSSAIFNQQTVQRIYYLHMLALENPQASWQYNKQMQELANYHKIRLDPSIKHTFCKNCYQSFGTGVMKVENGKLLAQCSKCGKTKIIKTMSK